LIWESLTESKANDPLSFLLATMLALSDRMQHRRRLCMACASSVALSENDSDLISSSFTLRLSAPICLWGLACFDSTGGWGEGEWEWDGVLEYGEL
jgi:hypothetical protein